MRKLTIVQHHNCQVLPHEISGKYKMRSVIVKLIFLLIRTQYNESLLHVLKQEVYFFIKPLGQPCSISEMQYNSLNTTFLMLYNTCLNIYWVKDLSIKYISQVELFSVIKSNSVLQIKLKNILQLLNTLCFAVSELQ